MVVRLTTNFLGEIRLFAGAAIPPGWADCDGSTLPIAGNEALAQLIGGVYGPLTATTITLPDLRGRTPVHTQVGILQLGISGGTETATISATPIHNHLAGCFSSGLSSGVGTETDPTGKALGINGQDMFANLWVDGVEYASRINTMLAAASIGSVGGRLPHPNLQPFIALHWIICISAGIFPASDVAAGGAFSSVYLGGRIFWAAFANPPAGHMRADGPEISRTIFSGLFALYGETFGAGDGSTTFALPLLPGRCINGAGTGSYSGASTYAVGDQAGESSHALTLAEYPGHTHPFQAVSDAADTVDPSGAFLASAPAFSIVDAMHPIDHVMSPSTVGYTGVAPITGLDQHPNQQPFLGVTALVCTDDKAPNLNAGDIVIGPWTTAPVGLQACDGTSLLASAEPALFAVIGYTYGGSAGSFNVPDTRGRIPVGVGQGPESAYTLGQTGGTETVTLDITQVPPHSHSLSAVSGSSVTGQGGDPAGMFFAKASGGNAYKVSGAQVALNAGVLSLGGGDLPHENRMLQTAFHFFIAL